MVPIFKATVKHGKVVFHNLDLLNSYLISLENKDVEVIVRKKKKRRTNPQNAWYWACVVGIPAEHFGYLPDEMHDAFKWMFLKRECKGKPVTVRSTTSLTTTEFSEYTEKCRQWAAEEGINIPSPDEVDFSGKDEEIEKENNKPVDQKTLDEIFNWTGKGITEARIMEISKANFGREPGKLTQIEALKLDTLIITELPL